MKTSIRIPGTAAVAVTVLCCISFGRAATSDLFVKTVRKLMNDDIRERVLAAMPPLTSIVAADLIDRVINGSDRDEIVVAAVDVGVMMVFMNAVSGEVDSLCKKYPEVVDSAARRGVSQAELVAYSSMYYYCSERLKNDLYVSKKILKLNEVKNTLESIVTGNDRKWVALVSQRLIEKRRREGKYLYDVRLNELMRFAARTMVDKQSRSDDALRRAVLSTVDTFMGSEKDTLRKLLGITDTTARDLTSKVLKKIFSWYERSLKGADSPDGIEAQLFQPLRTAFTYDYLDTGSVKDAFCQTTYYLIDRFASLSEGKRHGFEYIVSVAGGALVNTDDRGTEMNAMILDQIRYSFVSGPLKVFLFTGGFIDPLMNTMLDNDSTRQYLTGAGVQFRNVYIAAGAGIPYPEFKRDRVKAHLTVGYEIPLQELFN